MSLDEKTDGADQHVLSVLKQELELKLMLASRTWVFTGCSGIALSSVAVVLFADVFIQIYNLKY